MNKINNKRHKPLYKKFISLKANVQNRPRLKYLKFKKQKWQRLIRYIERNQNRRKKNYKLYDLNKYHLSKFYTPFNKKYKTVLISKKSMSLFYGSISINYIKTCVNSSLKTRSGTFNQTKILFLSLLEYRLDVVLYRSHFVSSIQNARQLILHEHIKVNNVIITTSSYRLKKGDTITINKKILNLIYSNILKSNFWPIPPKYLNINYTTLKIILENNIEYNNLGDLYPFRLNIFALLQHYN